MPQKTANFGNKDRQNRPHRDDFLLGSVSSTVPENRSVVSVLPASVARGGPMVWHGPAVVQLRAVVELGVLA